MEREHEQIARAAAQERAVGSRSGGRPVLEQVHVASFEASPASISPFGRAELRWDVVGPDGGFTLTLDGQQVERRGIRTVSPPRTTTYVLEAHGAGFSHPIGSVQVEVDTGACETTELANGLVARFIESEVEGVFEDGDKVALRGAGASAQVGEDRIAVAVPLKIDVPKWFDADADVELAFSVGTRPGERGHRVAAGLARADVDVRWSWYEHAASLGCTSAVQAATQRLMKAMIDEVLGAVWAEDIRREFQSRADAAVREAAEGDDREFVLRSLEVGHGPAIVFQVCPEGSGQGGTGSGSHGSAGTGTHSPGTGQDSGGAGPGSGSGPVSPPRGPSQPGGGVQPL